MVEIFTILYEKFSMLGMLALLALELFLLWWPWSLYRNEKISRVEIRVKTIISIFLFLSLNVFLFLYAIEEMFKYM
jgi:hypothetical protein